MAQIARKTKRYPSDLTDVRGGGTGIVLGVGRGGAAPPESTEAAYPGSPFR
jgi:hypothetical protein